jgi:alkylhydroperoxidase family enzyme
MPRNSKLEPLALFRILARHEELFSRMRPLGAGILGHGRVSPRDREIVIHRTCARTGAAYEWGVHAVVYGRPAGLTEEQLEATQHGDADDPAWSGDDRLLIELADQLHDTCTIDDALWSRLTRRFEDDQMLELLLIAGWYRLISYVVNAAGVEPEAWAARVPAPTR